MKQARIVLPFIDITITTAVEAGSIVDLNELPLLSKRIASATTGEKTTLYFYAQRGKTPVENFDKKFIVANLAKKIAEVIREEDLMGDGIGKVFQQIAPEHLFKAEELRRDLPFGSSEITVSPDFYLWVATEGQTLAKKLLEAAGEVGKPHHMAHVSFAIKYEDEGEPVGAFCLPLANGARLKGELYMGDCPEKATEEDMSGVGGLVLGLMKRSVGLNDKNAHAVVFNRTTHSFGAFAGAQRTFTAVFYLPFKGSADWFEKDALASIINRAIDFSLKQTMHLFGDMSAQKE